MKRTENKKTLRLNVETVRTLQRLDDSNLRRAAGGGIIHGGPEKSTRDLCTNGG